MFFYDGNVLHIGNFKSIKHIDSEIIVILFEKYQLIIAGDALKIINLIDEEMYVQGCIKEIRISYDF